MNIDIKGDPLLRSSDFVFEVVACLNSYIGNFLLTRV